MIRTVTYDDSTHKIVPLEPIFKITNAMAGSKAKDDEGEFPCLVDLLGYSGENKNWTVIRQAWKDGVLAAPEYQEPDIRAKLAVNIIKYLGATKSQAKAIIDGVFDGEHTINESDLKYQEPTKDE